MKVPADRYARSPRVCRRLEKLTVFAFTIKRSWVLPHVKSTFSRLNVTSGFGVEKSATIALGCCFGSCTTPWPERFTFQLSQLARFFQAYGYRMEGPSIHLAAEQLSPFVGRRVNLVAGNSTIGIERLRRKTVRDIFAWGKHLVFQFDRFALRVHFMLWGTFAATVNGRSVTGDYRRGSAPRLTLTFANGEITIWAASLRFVEEACAKLTYDFTVDVLSDTWHSEAVLVKMRQFPRAEIADVLLDQSIFAGVGNIIKNEVLFRTRTSPFERVGRLSDERLKAIVADARAFSFRFLELRRVFALRKHLEVYGRTVCPACGGPLRRKVHGDRSRRSFFCRPCQRVRRVPAKANT